jgi:hypothetical protein
VVVAVAVGTMVGPGSRVRVRVVAAADAVADMDAVAVAADVDALARTHRRRVVVLWMRRTLGVEAAAVVRSTDWCSSCTTVLENTVEKERVRELPPTHTRDSLPSHGGSVQARSLNARVRLGCIFFVFRFSSAHTTTSAHTLYTRHTTLCTEYTHQKANESVSPQCSRARECECIPCVPFPVVLLSCCLSIRYHSILEG